MAARVWDKSTTLDGVGCIEDLMKALSNLPHDPCVVS